MADEEIAEIRRGYPIFVCCVWRVWNIGQFLFLFAIYFFKLSVFSFRSTKNSSLPSLSLAIANAFLISLAQILHGFACNTLSQAHVLLQLSIPTCSSFIHFSFYPLLLFHLPRQNSSARYCPFNRPTRPSFRLCILLFHVTIISLLALSTHCRCCCRHRIALERRCEA